MTGEYYGSGGFGVDPCGEHPFGAAKDLFTTAPQFREGYPRDEQKRISVSTFVEFGTYYYGSHCEVERMRVEASLDNGASYEDVYLGDVVASELGKSAGYQSGYSGRVFRTDGHNVSFVFVRGVGWPNNQEVYIRFTGQDGYGRQALKTQLVTWS